MTKEEVYKAAIQSIAACPIELLLEGEKQPGFPIELFKEALLKVLLIAETADNYKESDAAPDFNAMILEE